MHYEIHRNWDHIVGAPCYKVYERVGTHFAGTSPCGHCGMTLRVTKCGAECTAKTAVDKGA